MELHELNPCLRFIQKRTVMHSYPENVLAYDHRLICLLADILTVTADGRDYSLNPDTILMIPPGIPYRLTVAEGQTAPIYILNFDMSFSSSETESMHPDPEDSFSPERIVSREAPPELTGIRFFDAPRGAAERLREMADCYEKERPYFRHECGTHLKLLLLSLLRTELTRKNAMPPAVTRLLKYIDTHYAEPLSNHSLAAEFQYHPNHLGRICREATGMSLHHLVIDRRLRAAKELLAATDISIEETARRVGFESPSYFSKYFRSSFGISPYAWRERHREWIL